MFYRSLCLTFSSPFCRADVNTDSSQVFFIVPKPLTDYPRRHFRLAAAVQAHGHHLLQHAIGGGVH